MNLVYPLNSTGLWAHWAFDEVNNGNSSPNKVTGNDPYTAMILGTPYLDQTCDPSSLNLATIPSCNRKPLWVSSGKNSAELFPFYSPQIHQFLCNNIFE